MLMLLMELALYSHVEAELARFPPPGVACEQRAFAVQMAEQLELEARWTLSEPAARQMIEQAGEMRKCDKCWQALADAKGWASWHRVGQGTDALGRSIEYLARLRYGIGEEAYFAGRMPCPMLSDRR